MLSGFHISEGSEEEGKPSRFGLLSIQWGFHELNTRLFMCVNSIPPDKLAYAPYAGLLTFTHSASLLT